MLKLLKNFYDDFNYINSYYNNLVERTKKLEYVGITNEWLIDNFYLLVEHKTNITSSKKQLKKAKKTLNKLYDCLKNIVVKYNYNINYKNLINELKKYQKTTKTTLTFKEISVIKIVLIFIYTERLRHLCIEELNKLTIKDNISKIIKNNPHEVLELKDFNIGNYQDINNNYLIFELNNQLNQEENRNTIFKELNETLESKNISLKDLINDEYQKKIDNDILISNIFGDLREIFEYSDEDMFEKISKVEKLLLEDEIYAQMTDDSKDLYRKQLIKLAKRNHLSELNYLEKLYEKNKDKEDYHIGFSLFKKQNKTFNTIFYVCINFFLTIIISYLLSRYFIKLSILGFLILLVPVNQLLNQIINQIIIKFVPTKPLAKLDYSKGIPEESRTMVVIPTIVSTKEKIKDMFDTLETFYLINKSDNLYFSLLGDVKASDKQIEDYDEDLGNYGQKYAEELNKKYNKDLFYFLYRKRVWNEKEGSFLGYERKRGALLHFNKILLGEYVDETKYFNVNMLHHNDLEIKYVITLDSDTRLVLNTALNLVGAMAHPLNKPVLNKKLNKVVSGYGIMQPRVSVDIEATNKSLYSQVFAGIGGFDTYSVIVPNVYQDAFNEGSFIGKGIYDLEVFDKVLSNAFPENLILSHDLLEGNYLRCAYVSDIELIDDFPSKFLTDITRHHRWARGDTQIIGWLLPKVKNKNNRKVKNPLNLLGKYKILDNIIRMFLPPTLLITLLCSIFFSKYKFLWLAFVLLEIALPILFFLYGKKYRNKKESKVVYYKNLYHGGKSIVLRSYIILATLPFYTKLYMDAFFRTLYRLFISHKNLLNWITAEEVEKTVDGSLKNYLKNFLINIIFAIALFALGIYLKNVEAIILGLIFLSAPFLLCYISKTIDTTEPELKEKKLDTLNELAKRTWNYFSDNLKPEYNYLIPDNYQENREQKLDLRTSPTAIGFSLTSVVAAVELELIDKEEAFSLIKNILESVESLEKWHGHLYNWYDIKTKKIMPPAFVSTVDSGNFVASLITVREFLNENLQNDLVKICDKLINNTNFKKLYTKKDVFSIGYDEIEGRLSPYNYNKFASESRLTSFVSIIKGDVPSKHWFSLDKSLTIYKKRKGLISWSGTSFEYYMPLLFMKNYPNTLFDESYHFAAFCQKEYINSISTKLPWGISESAYAELDNSLNYKYKAFSTPYLKAKEDKENRIVLAPYASIMALELFPNDVYTNIEKFKNLKMYDKYGLYESYDYDNKEVVKAYFAHHQGMILLGLVNYLKKCAIKNYFHKNVNVRTFDILLKEKVQIKTTIDLKMANYKKYDYNKEKIENDIRAFNYISYMPEVSVLSNKKYALLMNDRGDSFSRYRTLQLNRYRKVTELDYGIFLFIKDTKTKYIWSNTFAPMNIKPDKYEVVFASDKIKFLRTDGYITTKTEIVVTRTHHAEIRKITFKNTSDVKKELELTTYTEPILSENMDDVSHKTFNNMFITSFYDTKYNALIVKRKSRKDNKINSYMVNRLIIDDASYEYSYETERSNFIGRNNNLNNAIGLDKELSNYSGDNLDPIMSIRNKIVIDANSEKVVYLLVGFGRSREQINSILQSYNNDYELEKAFKVAPLMNIINTKNMNLTGEKMRTFNIMLNYLYQTTKISVTEERMDLLRQNALSQEGLWKFSISGDRPIILVEIKDISDIGFVMDILKAFEYYKNNSIFVDIVIINSETGRYQKMIKKQIDDEMYRMYTLNSFYHTPGGITVINNEELNEEEKSLLAMVPRLRFVIDNHETLEEAVENLQKNNTISDYPTYSVEKTLPLPEEKLNFDNGYGGFKNNGREYVIYNKDTPAPWVNIIANKNFGTIVTNNGCGYTYAYNSSEFKITSWNNEMVVNDKSEGFKFNGKIFDPTKCIHGFGYSILENETADLKKDITEFVAYDDNIKIYLMHLTNKHKKKLNEEIEFWINPTFGNFEEKTSRHILTEFMGNDNYVKMRNVYTNNYSDVNVFMSSSEKIVSAICDRTLIKNFTVEVSLEPEEEKNIIFVLGCSKSDKENLELIAKYTNLANVKKELKLVKDNWINMLNTVQVSTSDKSFDYVVNGWYLYQTMSSRILARAGYYQVSGAFGYRDQLQDSMNIAFIKPDFTREQILINAKHQFIEGDVLHWWHEKNHFGLRSKFKDDYLWLVYATCYYIEVTGDYKILDEKVPYITGEKLSDYEAEKGIVFNYLEESDTLLAHCLKAIDIAINSLGTHKLPLMGGGDWNDGMNRVGIKGKGESVWLGFFLYNCLDNFIKVLKKHTKVKVSKYVEFNEKLAQNLNKKAWDGNYYLRAFYDNGDKLGSHENNECKIDLISQSFSILSDVAPKDRIQSIITSVQEQLVDENLGIIKLLTPAFEKSLNNPGYIMDYHKGIRENGGQYTHAVAWYLMALIKTGYHDRAYRYFQMINPIERSTTKKADNYKVEPYVIAADIYSAKNFAGRGGWTWYTGSAGWFYRIAITEILGLKKKGDKLKLDPRMPIAWDGFKMVYHYEDTTYNIEVIKAKKDELKVDGKKQISNTIDLVNDNRTHEVTLYIK